MNRHIMATPISILDSDLDFTLIRNPDGDLQNLSNNCRKLKTPDLEFE